LRHSPLSSCSTFNGTHISILQQHDGQAGTPVPVSFYFVAFSNPDLYHLIFDACTPQAMFRLGRSSSHSFLALKNYMKVIFDPNAHFGRFF